jgi:indolepyruvate ferredoxin oxidoreductase beta subunit
MRAPGAGCQIVICGLGGQGILFLSRVLAVAAMLDGEDVLTAETHGMSQRGGAVEAHLKVGAFESSLVRPGSADAVLVLDPSRVGAGVGMLRTGGTCVANAREAHSGVKAVDAAGEARALGDARGQNLVLLGYATALAPDVLPTQDALREALRRLSPAAALAPNQGAFERGVALVQGA